MNKNESKYFNTAKRMNEAFLLLLEKKEYAYITVKEVCEKAGVNRSTFYLHYETMRDLLTESAEYMLQDFNAYMNQEEKTNVDIINGSLENLYLIDSKYLTPYLNYIKEHKRLFVTAIQKADTLALEKSYSKLFEHVINPILDRYKVKNEDKKYMVSFYINGMMAVINEWIKEDCKDSIEHIIKVIQTCIKRPKN